MSHESGDVPNHATWLFVQQLVRLKKKENVTAPYDWPFVRETGHRWISLIKGQQWGKPFQVMMCSCCWYMIHSIHMDRYGVCVDRDFCKIWWENMLCYQPMDKDSLNNYQSHTYMGHKLIIMPADLSTWPHDDVTNGNIFSVTGPLRGESTGHQWIPLAKASDAELWSFFDLRLNKRLSKQSRRRWFETPSRWLWRHSNALGHQ